MISTLPDVISLCEEIEKNNLRLKIAFDVPQIYTAHNAITKNDYLSILKQAVDIRNRIGGVHLWGKRRSDTGRKVSHCGGLTSFFENEIIKRAFLPTFVECFDDGVIRKMVLEVNSGNEDLISIIDDLQGSGVLFV